MGRGTCSATPCNAHPLCWWNFPALTNPGFSTEMDKLRYMELLGHTKARLSLPWVQAMLNQRSGRGERAVRPIGIHQLPPLAFTAVGRLGDAAFIALHLRLHVLVQWNRDTDGGTAFLPTGSAGGWRAAFVWESTQLSRIDWPEDIARLSHARNDR